MLAQALPSFTKLAAPASWQAIDLLSDVHLQLDQPGTFEAWRHHLLNTPADAVLILGDLFEVWSGDDALDGAFERGLCRGDRPRQRFALRRLHGGQSRLPGGH